MFKRILIANRGEIALRVIRACRELEIASVAVYSDVDRDALHVRFADEAYHIGPSAPSQSYLNIERLVDVAKRAHCEGVHPGYGFLAENAAFARACEAAGLVFIGPSPAAMERMGDKIAARSTALKSGVPVVPGTTEPIRSLAEARALADRFGFPLAIKASAGGGGKGLKVATSAADLEQAVSLAAKEAGAYFKDDTIYVERYLDRPKHVEVQILGDKHGRVVHLGERDCSLQRRHQKLIEETPANISDALRDRMHQAAVQLGLAIGYDSAGTIECLVSGDQFYFLEMNTRIQVEHTISEATFGFDLVKAQIRVGAGEKLSVTQEQLAQRGHAIECRINAESPARNFLPSPGRIRAYQEPAGPGVRVDSAAFEGWEIPSDYDSLVGKLIVWGADRNEALHRTARALQEYRVEGVETTIPFYQLLLKDPEFVRGDYSTATVDVFTRAHLGDIRAAYESGSSGAGTPLAVGASAETFNSSDSTTVTVEVNEKRFDVRIFGVTGITSGASARRAPAYKAAKPVGFGGTSIPAPMHGIIAELLVQPEDHVRSDQVVAIIEAMKMMNEVSAHRDGKVKSVDVAIGQTVETGSSIITFAD